MNSTLRELLLTRLEGSDLDAHARAEVTTATGPPDGATEQEAGTVVGEVYLRSVEVEGFRGIGPAARLELPARPGLTVVVGRNGSGKSSFAEGLELLSTGVTKRWATRSKGWTSAWQCLHHSGPTRISAELVVAGQDQPVVLEQTWGRGVPYTDDADRAGVAAALAERGWDRALESFRPFLTYSELAAMFDKLTSLYQALSPILGLEDVDAVLQQLAAARLDLERDAKAAKAQVAALADSLDDADPRQASLAALLGTRKPKFEEVRAHLTSFPPGTGEADDESRTLRQAAAAVVPDDEAITVAHQRMVDAIAAVQRLATTDATRALATAELLSRALSFRNPGDPPDACPVCGTASVLDEDWVTDTTAEVAALRRQATQLSGAESERTDAVDAWKRVARQVLGSDTATLEDVLAGAAIARATADSAKLQLAQLDTVWRTRIEETIVWLRAADDVNAQTARLKALKTAEAWLRSEADDLRNERFAPIAAKAVANWELLRQDSSVELRDITLKSVGRNREATFDVRADGEGANAIGVMSQGELLALSVSVFLPRAGLEESPFRFAVIDDPVQSMDPAKVDGLARVLSAAAKTRQVVVFTHDDRLPEAIRRLKLPATVLQVNRRSRSQVSVTESRSPIRRHLDDAKGLALSDRVPDEVRQRIVPTLCRNAVEAACAEVVRARVVREGKHASAADDQLVEARTLRDHLALALLEDRADHTGLTDEIRRCGGNDGPSLVAALNAGAHGEYAGSLTALQSRTTEFVHALMQSL